MTHEELINYNGPDKVVTFAEKMEQIKNHPLAILRVNTHIPLLDKYIEGFETGELVVLAGTTGGGKSLCLQTFHRNFCRQGQHVLWFSYELTPLQFLLRFPELPDGRMPDEMVPANLPWVFQRILESKAKSNTSIVMIDHLHFLFDMTMEANHSITIGGIMRKLKLFAVKEELIMLLICHITKVNTRDNKKPTELDGEMIRDSSFIRQEADTVLLVWRLVDDESKGQINEARLKVDKSRRVGTMGKIVRIKKVNGWLEETVDLPKLESDIENPDYAAAKARVDKVDPIPEKELFQ